MNNLRQGERGYALVTALILTAISTVLVLGFYNQVNTAQKISMNDTDYSGAFYAAEAGLEKLNSDLAKLFLQSTFPSQTALTDIQDEDHRPSLPTASYSRYELTGGQTARLSAAINATATTAQVNSTTGWPTRGFFMIDGEELTYTGITANTFTGLARGQNGSTAASHINNSNVFRSSVVTLTEGANAGLNAQMVPFTLDVTARSGVGTEARLTREVQAALIPVFQFGIFSDSDLSFFAGPNFNFGGRVHSNGNIFLAEGNSGTLTLSQKITSAGDIIRQYLANGLATGSSYAGPVMVATSPGVYRALGLGEGSVTGSPGSTAYGLWPGLSLSTYHKNILSGQTGAKSLKLPFVADGYSPVELIKRPPTGEATDTLMGESRLANQASLRIYISNTAAQIPGGTGYDLDNTLVGYAPVDDGTDFRPPFAEANPADPDFLMANGNDETAAAPLIGGFVYIERHNTDGTWSDVTMEILNLGISTNQTNSILRFQKPRWDPMDPTNSLNASDYVPINMYDAREGRFRDNNSSVGSNLRKLGIMNIVELDVRKLKDWFSGTIGTTGTLAVNNNGYILYFSDRRGNRDNSGNETGELGFEDFVNAGDVEGNPNGGAGPEVGEDLNGNGSLEVYGANLPYSPYSASTDLYATAVPAPKAAVAINLTEHIDSTETGIDVTSTTGFTVPGYYRLDQEIVQCTSATSTTLTCTRGQLGTAAAAHSPNQSINLSVSVNNSTTSFTVGSDTNVTVPGYYRIESETVLCSAKAANVLTCARGQMGTTAAAHNVVTNWVNVNLTNATTSITVVSGSSFPTAASWYRIDNETVSCTRSSNTLTCTRGELGTTAAAHALATANLSVNANSTTTTFTFSSGATSVYTVPGIYRIENEVVSCTAKTLTTMTCTRAQEGTTAASHTSGKALQTRVRVDLVNVLPIKVFTSETASKNRVHYFRHALRVMNGTSPNLPTPGFTAVSENPMYVMGNYNSNGTADFSDSHAAAAVIADAVTLLSNGWVSGGDERSFIFPYAVGSRPGTTTFYRMAIAAGKGINFTKPTEETTVQDFGTDGGTHNFLRYLETWSGQTSNYRGSIVSLYYYRQAIGPYKCCSTVYTPPTRSYAFDTDFLVPSQLPPGTPKFRDINNLSFRQTIRADTD